MPLPDAPISAHSLLLSGGTDVVRASQLPDPDHLPAGELRVRAQAVKDALTKYTEARTEARALLGQRRCATADVLAHWGLGLEALYDDASTRRNGSDGRLGEALATYVYRDESGQPLHEIRRFANIAHSPEPRDAATRRASSADVSKIVNGPTPTAPRRNAAFSGR